MRMGGGYREKGIQALAWISFGFAVVGGAAITGTLLGDCIVALVRIFPNWVATAAFAGGVVALSVDLFVDQTPNRLALWMAILLPSVARATTGKLSDSVTELSDKAAAQVNGGLGEWLGVASYLGLAVACVVISQLMARRVIAKGGR